MTKYLAIYLLFLLIFSAPLSLNYTVLGNVGERLSIQKIVDIQQNSNKECLYGTALHDNELYYKLESYERIKPEAIALGSSTVLQISDQFFDSSFYNMGRAMGSIGKGQNAVDLMLAAHKPKIILLGIDFWWFNERRIPPLYPVKPMQQDVHFKPQHLVEPIGWVLQGKISLQDYAFLLKNKSYKGQIDHCAIGIQALKNKAGFSRNGVHHKAGYTVGKIPNPSQEQFKNVLGYIEHGTKRFQYASKAHPQHMEQFLSLVEKIQNEGVELVLFFPPLAPTVWEALQKHEYGIIEDIQQQLTANGITYYDFMDPHRIGSNDCEFLDGFHGGSITYARVLKNLAGEDENLSTFIRGNTVEKIIDQYKGSATISLPDISTQPEVDFLKLGCLKRRS